MRKGNIKMDCKIIKNYTKNKTLFSFKNYYWIFNQINNKKNWKIIN